MNPFNEGYIAFYDGGENPYRPGTEDCDAWEVGYAEAEDDFARECYAQEMYGREE